MSPANSDRVWVVEDDERVRRSLTWLLESVGLAVHEFPGAEPFLEALDPTRPGCVLLDIRMPGMGGLELQQLLARDHPLLPVILITGHGDVPMAVRALKAGAYDFFEKPFNDQELLERAQAAIQQHRAALAEAASRAGIEQRIARLTPRERDVLALMLEGAPGKVMAARLHISPRTADVHRHNVMEKMEAASLAELIQLCLAAGLKPG